MELYRELEGTYDKEQQRELFRQILEIAKDEFYAIGTVFGKRTTASSPTTSTTSRTDSGGLYLYPHSGGRAPRTVLHRQC